MNDLILSICIPNYNRLEKLKRLIEEIIRQIKLYDLYKHIEISISDDASREDPTEYITSRQRENPDINIFYIRNEMNKGMDYNFLQSVESATGEYCWIIGNDDLLTDNGLARIIDLLNFAVNNEVALIVTPFESCDEDGNEIEEIYPFGKYKESQIFDTSNKKNKEELFLSIENNTAIFGFLSNAVFRKSDWVRHKDIFNQKMDTIFIQVYMNMQTLMEGCRYYYSTEKIIRNYRDMNPEDPIRLWYKVVKGLYDAIVYFIPEEYRKQLQEKVVAEFVSVKFWENKDELSYLAPVFDLELEKIKVYNKYFVSIDKRKELLKDKDIFIFGAESYGKCALEVLEAMPVNVLGFLDNNKQKIGEKIKQYEIYSPEILNEFVNNENCFIAIASGRYAGEIATQVEALNMKNLIVIS